LAPQLKKTLWSSLNKDVKNLIREHLAKKIFKRLLKQRRKDSCDPSKKTRYIVSLYEDLYETSKDRKAQELLVAASLKENSQSGTNTYSVSSALHVTSLEIHILNSNLMDIGDMYTSQPQLRLDHSQEVQLTEAPITSLSQLYCIGNNILASTQTNKFSFSSKQRRFTR
jgi:hypothetical protein